MDGLSMILVALENVNCFQQSFLIILLQTVSFCPVATQFATADEDFITLTTSALRNGVQLFRY